LALPGQPVAFPLTWNYCRFVMVVLVGSLRLQKDRETLHGLIALEAGQTEVAREQFRKALQITAERKGSRTDLDFSARASARHYLDLVERSSTGQ
jgi:hypothetical protein